MIGFNALRAEHARTGLRPPLRWSQSRAADRLVEILVTAVAGSVILLVLLIAWQLWTGSAESRQAFGWGFVTSSAWNPVKSLFGAAPFIFGTLMTSLFALLFAGPLGVGAAVFLVEIAPPWLRAAVGFLVEMLAAIPSVIYGLWAIFVLVPFVRGTIQPALGSTLGFLPLFKGPPYGVGYLSAGLVLVIMVLPTITAVSQAVLAAVPAAARDGAYALGATRWEVVAGVVLPAARSGIIGGLMLGLGRALGETMAVTMVIGNRPAISWSLFALGDTMASVIANQFSEATSSLYTSSLVQIGLVLFVVTVLINLVALLLVTRFGVSYGERRA